MKTLLVSTWYRNLSPWPSPLKRTMTRILKNDVISALMYLVYALPTKGESKFHEYLVQCTLQYRLKKEHCKPHKGVGHQINVINYVKLFPTVYCRINILRYPIRRRVTKASA